MNIFVPLVLALALSPAVPFHDPPVPVDGPASLASLASRAELDAEPAYTRFKSTKLNKVDSWFALGGDYTLSLPETQALYILVKDATTQSDPGSLCIVTPRHYFSYTSTYGVVKVLLCFECHVAVFSINGWSTSRVLDPSVQARLNAILQKHGVPIPVSK